MFICHDIALKVEFQEFKKALNRALKTALKKTLKRAPMKAIEMHGREHLKKSN